MPSFLTRAFAPFALAAAFTLASAGSGQDVIANGDTRTITLFHAHRQDTGTFTFRRWGSYDQSVLRELNHFLRDWRNDESIAMDPKLFDVVWAIYRESGANEPVKVMSAYRSPGTNGMLRRRSRGVAKNSQHMAGKAMDIHIPGISMAKARETGLRLQHGGIGYYPGAGSAFIHVDTGWVRHWPRVTRDHLARIFPDGKTVHIPADGKPMPGYELAQAEIEARGGQAVALAEITSRSGRGLWAFLFGGGEDDEPAAAPRGRNSRIASRGRREQVAALPQNQNTEDAGIIAFARTGGGVEENPLRAAAPPRPAPRAPERIDVAARPEAETARPAPAPAAGEVKIEPAPKAVQPSLAALANVPLPPARPADTGARPAALASVEITNARPALAAYVPLPPSRPQRGAAGEVETAEAETPKATGAPAAKPQDQADEPQPLKLASVPLPPERPRAENAVAAAEAKPQPLPEPSERQKGLIGLFAGAQTQPSAPAAALSFAPAQVPLPPSRLR